MSQTQIPQQGGFSERYDEGEEGGSLTLDREPRKKHSEIRTVTHHLQRLDDDTLAEANKGNVRAIANLIELEDAPLLARFAKQRLAE